MKKIQINKTPLLQIHIHPLVSIHIVLMVGTYFHLGHVTSLKSCSTQTATATTHIRPFHLKHRLRTLICIFTLLQITTVAGSTRHVLNTHTHIYTVDSGLYVGSNPSLHNRIYLPLSWINGHSLTNDRLQRHNTAHKKLQMDTNCS